MSEAAAAQSQPADRPVRADPREAVRVLHVVNGLGLGGTEKAMQLYAASLDRGRFFPCVWSRAGGARQAQLRRAGVPVMVGIGLDQALAQFDPDIVHVHRAGWPEPELMRPLARARRHATRPAVVETNVFGRFDPSPSGEVIDVHHFLSAFCAARYDDLYGPKAAAQARRVIPYPVDTAAFAGTAELPRPGAVVGRLSRADPGKWSRLALDIIPLLAGRLPEFAYRVIGGTPEAREFVRAGGLADRVAFLPEVADDAGLAGFFAGLAVLAHANDTGETFGLAIAEAMAAGLPVVTHPCPYPKDNAQVELVEHGITGFVAEGAEDYAAAVAWLLTHPQAARAMGRAGRDKVVATCDAAVVTAQVESLYLELLGRA